MTAPAAFSAPPSIALDGALLDRVDGALGLAVSGGGDSTALAHLLSAHLPDRRLVLLTVDHRLRAGSAEDAAFVVRLGARLGRPVETLAVTDRPTGSLQTWARDARYRLLADAARRLDLAAIVTGHTRDDQAETFLLRLARGSGLRGLAAMRPLARRDGLTILRPLLAVSRAELRDYLVAHGLDWRDDPSNEDMRFDRIAVRTLAPRLAAVGLTAERLAGAAGHLARASEAIDGLAAALGREAMRVDRAGAVTLARGPFEAAHEEVRLRVLAEAVQTAGGLDYPPRFDALLRAAATPPGDAMTLGRACLRSEADRIVLWREARGIAPLRLEPGTTVRFDGRYDVTLAAEAPPVRLAAITDAAARRIPTDAFRPAVATGLGAYHDDVLVAAPTLGVRLNSWPADRLRVTRVR
ncbi:tRNA lysidine(34) synthetase TilS [Acuticoccus sp. M5D2P5]|uniref:tRNA lysidine(34) synthetase TilS n=1 Tax=Acuticoccus kalidii TaxID=2910977 RepID=UPI001F15D4AF|nr:tRNA lysidine(34) synthetase TilS [Acuticoccus kalidii]MCF3933492.1 tRNA lysidine(34) synthetase TilS [Acuticoccus kalidii]